MELSLPKQVERLIEDRVASGQYRTAEDVVSAAVAQLDQQEQVGEFDAGELDRMLAEGESSGAPLAGEDVLVELESLRRQSKTKAG